MALDLQSKTDYAVFFEDGTLYKNTSWDKDTHKIVSGIGLTSKTAESHTSRRL